MAAGFTCLRQVQSLEQGSGNVGLEPRDVDLVIQTQLHFDRIGCLHKFSKAKSPVHFAFTGR